jgi:hypothetical protein
MSGARVVRIVTREEESRCANSILFGTMPPSHLDQDHGPSRQKSNVGLRGHNGRSTDVVTVNRTAGSPSSLFCEASLSAPTAADLETSAEGHERRLAVLRCSTASPSTAEVRRCGR